MSSIQAPNLVIVLPGLKIFTPFPPHFPHITPKIWVILILNDILGISPNEYFPAIFFGSTRHPPEQDYAKIGLFWIMSRFMSIFIGPYLKIYRDREAEGVKLADIVLGPSPLFLVMIALWSRM